MLGCLAFIIHLHAKIGIPRKSMLFNHKQKLKMEMKLKFSGMAQNINSHDLIINIPPGQ